MEDEYQQDEFQQAGQRIFDLLSRKRALEQQLNEVDQLLELLMQNPIETPRGISSADEDEVDTASISHCA